MSVCGCVCLCVMLVKLLEKCAFYVGGVGRQGLLRTITIAADCRFHLKHLLVLFEKKNASKKVCVFQIVFESLSLDCKRYSWLFKILLVYRTIKGYFL